MVESLYRETQYCSWGTNVIKTLYDVAYEMKSMGEMHLTIGGSKGVRGSPPPQLFSFFFLLVIFLNATDVPFS